MLWLVDHLCYGVNCYLIIRCSISTHIYIFGDHFWGFGHVNIAFYDSLLRQKPSNEGIKECRKNIERLLNRFHALGRVCMHVVRTTSWANKHACLQLQKGDFFSLFKSQWNGNKTKLDSNFNHFSIESIYWFEYLQSFINFKLVCWQVRSKVLMT